MLKIDIVTIFPGMFTGPFDLSIVKRAQEKGLVEITVHDLRKWTEDKRGTVDDRPYGGGAGMVMKIEPIAQAINSLKHQKTSTKSQINSKSKIQNNKQQTINNKQLIILTSPRGQVWNQNKAREFSQLDYLIIICGHYEGVDERVTNFIDEEISIGDYVLTGGEIPAMAIVDSIVRLIPGVLIKENVTVNESFSIPNTQYLIPNTSLLEYPQYTHPEDYNGLKVPPVLLSGNHKEISEWKKQKALEKTTKVRPDMLKCKHANEL